MIGTAFNPLYVIYNIPHCHGNRRKMYHILYKLKEGGSNRLDWDITGIKKPLSVTGALKIFLF